MSNISIKKFKKDLLRLGVKKNKSYFLHTSIIDVGCFNDNKIKNIPKNIYESIKSLVGKNGTISTLTANYDYGNFKKNFDLSSSPTTHDIGYFSKYFLNRKSSKRSYNPIFNISSEGKNARLITSAHSPNAFSDDSAWQELYKLNTEIIFIGCDISVCTFIRFIEFKFGVPYLYNKLFKTKIINQGKTIFNYSCSPVRYRKSKIEYDLKRFQKLLLKKKVLKVIKSQNFKIMLLKMQPCFKIGTEQLRKNIYYFLKRKPLYYKGFNPEK